MKLPRDLSGADFAKALAELRHAKQLLVAGACEDAECFPLR